MRRDVYQMIYSRLEDLGLNLSTVAGRLFEYRKSVLGGAMMPLSADYLGNRPGIRGDEDNYKSYDIALAHYYKQNGDMMADPDMEIRIFPELQMAEALTYQQDGLGLYQVVYPEPGKVYPRRKRDLNQFLNQWLRNAIDQGHRFTDERVASHG